MLIFFDYFCRMRNRSWVSEREFTRLVVSSVGQSFLPSFLPSLLPSFLPSFLPSLGRRLLFVFPLTNAQLDLTKKNVVANGSANVKQWNNNEVNFSYVKGVGCASILFFEFSKITYKAFVVIVMKSVGFLMMIIGALKNDKWEALIRILVEKEINK